VVAGAEVGFGFVAGGWPGIEGVVSVSVGRDRERIGSMVMREKGVCGIFEVFKTSI
jgi:hypothetical protein